MYPLSGGDSKLAGALFNKRYMILTEKSNKGVCHGAAEFRVVLTEGETLDCSKWSTNIWSILGLTDEINSNLPKSITVPEVIKHMHINL